MNKWKIDVIELENAVRDNDLEAVKALLATAYVDGKMNYYDFCDASELLYYTSTLEMTRLLLAHGAFVNITNVLKDTPLHCAVIERKGLEVVQELLKYGADVNIKNRRGDTPLNIAVKIRHLEVVKELVEYGSDINTKNPKCWKSLEQNSPLDNAIRNLECAKLVIKIALVKYFDENYKKFINLRPYKKNPYYGILSEYLEGCASEIFQMNAQEIKENFSLYDYLVRESGKGDITWQEGHEITEEDILNNYPIYRDMILEKVSLERPVLLNTLSEIQIYVSRNLDIEENRIILNFDCSYHLAAYLSNIDLLNLVKVFYKKEAFDFSENQQEEDKLEAFSSCSAKRQKLESSDDDSV